MKRQIQVYYYLNCRKAQWLHSDQIIDILGTSQYSIILCTVLEYQLFKISKRPNEMKCVSVVIVYEFARPYRVESVHSDSYIQWHSDSVTLTINCSDFERARNLEYDLDYRCCNKSHNEINKSQASRTFCEAKYKFKSPIIVMGNFLDN